MHRGYIKDWRKSLDNPLFKKPLIWHFWGYCLLKASHKDRDIFMNGQVIKIKKGQFVFGRQIASKETGISERSIRTSISHLQKLQNLTIKTTNKYSIITIINWDTYQAEETKTTNISTNDRPATDQQPTTDKNDKNNKTNKNTVTHLVNFKPTAEKIYQKYIEEIDPKLKTKQRAIKNIENWLRRGRSENDLVAAYKKYKELMPQDNKYRKNPANFYGINEDFAFDFMPINNKDLSESEILKKYGLL